METAHQLQPRQALGKRTRNNPEALFSRNPRSYAPEVAPYPVGLVNIKMNCIISTIACITDWWLTRSLFRPPSLHRHPPRDPLKDLITRGLRLRFSVLMELVATSMSLVRQIVPKTLVARQEMFQSLLARPHCPISSIIISLWAV